jgi:anti-anti-sigma factor
MPLSLDARFCGSVYIVRCQGEIVTGPPAKSLENFLAQRGREFTRLVLSLGAITRIDSTGVGFIVRYAARLRRQGGDLRMAEPPPFLINLLDITRLSAVMPVDASEEESIAALLEHRPAQASQEKPGPRVLLLHPSLDICAFISAVLRQHGFDVRPTCLLSDARIVLGVEAVDYLLVGAGSSQFSVETALATLMPRAPKAIVLRLEDDFNVRDADQASVTLLRMFPAPDAR